MLVWPLGSALNCASFQSWSPTQTYPLLDIVGQNRPKRFAGYLFKPRTWKRRRQSFFFSQAFAQPRAHGHAARLVFLGFFGVHGTRLQLGPRGLQRLSAHIACCLSSTVPDWDREYNPSGLPGNALWFDLVV